jgi:alkyl hydroperoxide reductase subunit AhpF
MALLGDDDVEYLKEQFARLTRDVTLTIVSREPSSLLVPGAATDATAELRQIVTELAAISPRIRVVTVDATAEAERARELVGERLPALVFQADRSRGRLRYYGLPAGYEMSTVVSTILDLGSDEEPLPADVAQRMDALAHDVRVQVFVTPS